MKNIETKERRYINFSKFLFFKLEMNKINNNVNARGIILSTLWKLYPFNILNLSIKILSIMLWWNID